MIFWIACILWLVFSIVSVLCAYKYWMKTSWILYGISIIFLVILEATSPQETYTIYIR
jgi:hypothetical protein